MSKYFCLGMPFDEVARAATIRPAEVLQPGGVIYVAYTNRVFLTRAVAVRRACADAERTQLIGGYLAEAGATPTSRPSGWWKEAPASIPLYVVSVRRV